jgi:glucose-6-phosphate 1-dehydrogenase
VLAAWQRSDPPLAHYEAGSQGPPEADRLLEGDDRWRAI